MRQASHMIPSPSWRGRWLPGLVVLTLLTTSQCVCQSSRPDDNPVPVHEKGLSAPRVPGSIDTSDMDRDELAVLHGVLSEQFDPCGTPRSFLEALSDKRPCYLAVKLGQYGAELVTKGLSKSQVTQRVLDELSRQTSKVEFDLTGSPYLGDPNAEHVIVEFTDFQCPYCRIAALPIKEMAQKYGAALYVKHLPLSFHPYAREAALVSLAAHAQGRFWEIYEALFKNQDRLDSDVIRELCVEAGLDMERLDRDLKGKDLAKVLKRDEDESDRFHVDGTPTFYLDGYMLELEQIEARLARTR